MTWIGTWTIRLVSVFVGIFSLMLALDILGLNKTSNPFTTWTGFVQCFALSVGIGILLIVEAVVQHQGWIVGPPFRITGGDSGTGPTASPPKEHPP